VHADYAKGMTMFQIYGGGSSLNGHYDFPGVSRDEESYADSGGVIGGQFLYFFMDNPCLAVGFDISHSGFSDHTSALLIANRLTQSSADNTTGVVVLRASFPKGHFRPYIQGGLGVHHTRLKLDAIPIHLTTWSDTGTSEDRLLYDDGHIGPALEGAIGMHIYFTERFFVGAELKVLSLIGKDFSPTAAGINEGLVNTRGAVSESGLGLMIGLGF